MMVRIDIYEMDDGSSFSAFSGPNADMVGICFLFFFLLLFFMQIFDKRWGCSKKRQKFF